jgi:hypothetical protein
MIDRYGPLISQVVSSLGNFAILGVASNRLSLGQFGKFSLVYALVLFISQVARSGLAESSMIEKLFAGPEKQEAASSVLGAGLAIAAAFGLLISIGALVTARSLTFAAACFVSVVSVVLTDMTRFVFFVTSPGTAVGIDLVWASVGLGLALVVSKLDGSRMLLIWGGSAALSAFLPFLKFQKAPALQSLKRFLSSSAARRLALDTAIVSSSGLILLFVLGLLVGSSAVGQFRSAVLPFTGVQIAFSGLYLSFLQKPDVMRLVRSPMMIFFVAIGILCSLLTGVVVRVVPSVLGERILGNGWNGAKSLAMVVAFQYAAFWFSESMVARLKIEVCRFDCCFWGDCCVDSLAVSLGRFSRSSCRVCRYWLFGLSFG